MTVDTQARFEVVEHRFRDARGKESSWWWVRDRYSKLDCGGFLEHESEAREHAEKLNRSAKQSLTVA